MAKSFSKLNEIGPGFWNLRGSFTFALGMIDIGTHMSFLRLNSGKFLIVDTCDVSASTKLEIDELTQNGDLIEAVIATHPFHTTYFAPFQKLYPNARFFGTPRHLRKFPSFPWVGSMGEESVRNTWENEGVSIRIPDGADFDTPAEGNHFDSAFVFHKESRTLHVDDTINCFHKPGFILSFVAKDGSMGFHPSTLKEGLLPTPEAPLQFQAWLEKLIVDWDFDNICSAHNGNKIGGAKCQLTELLESYKWRFQKLSNERRSSGGSDGNAKKSSGGDDSNATCG